MRVKFCRGFSVFWRSRVCDFTLVVSSLTFSLFAVTGFSCV